MNRNFCVQVTDRRLSSGHAIVTDEYEKCFALKMPGFNLSVAFAGLARVGSFSMHSWLLDTVCNLGELHNTPLEMIEALQERLNQLYRGQRFKNIDPGSKVLVISIVGFNLTSPRRSGVAGQIYNDSSGTFSFLPTSLKADAPIDWTWVGAFGSGGRATLNRENDIRELLRKDVGPTPVRQLLESIVRQSADAKTTAGTVGKQLDTIVLFSDPSAPVLSGGYSNVVQPHVRMPSLVDVGSQCAIAMTGFRVEPVEEHTPPLSIPKVRRNAPCPCGSGKKYKKCHGAKG